MSISFVLGGILVAALFIYLIVALVKPEIFP